MKNNILYQKVNSQDNKQIKLLQKLQAKKYREKFGLFAVENLVIIEDALRAGFDFESLFVGQEFYKKNQTVLKELENLSRAKEFFIFDDKLNKKVSSQATPSGILALYRIKKSKIGESSVVYLDGVSDPGNLGTIMRSALAFGFSNLVLDRHCVDVYNPKAIAAAKDAIFKLNIFEDQKGDWLEKCERPVYATSSHSGQALAEFEPRKNFVLVLGGESRGVDPRILRRADKTVKIEISDEIESLNVASAAAILFYEFRQK